MTVKSILCSIRIIPNFRLPKDRLYATYFGGDVKQGLEADEEARQLWLKYLPANRVLPFNMKVRMG